MSGGGARALSRPRVGSLCPCTLRFLLVIARLVTLWHDGAGVEAGSIPRAPFRQPVGATDEALALRRLTHWVVRFTVCFAGYVGDCVRWLVVMGMASRSGTLGALVGTLSSFW